MTFLERGGGGTHGRFGMSDALIKCDLNPSLGGEDDSFEGIFR